MGLALGLFCGQALLQASKLKVNTDVCILFLNDFLFSIYSWHPTVKIVLIFAPQTVTVGWHDAAQEDRAR